MTQPIDVRFDYLIILVYVIIVGIIGAAILFFSYYFGPKKRSKQKFEPYECGMDLLDVPHKKFNTRFYLIATLFILFDIETVFLIPWALIFKKINIDKVFLPVGNIPLWDMFIFLIILGVGLFYTLKRGALEWD